MKFSTTDQPKVKRGRKPGQLNRKTLERLAAERAALDAAQPPVSEVLSSDLADILPASPVVSDVNTPSVDVVSSPQAEASPEVPENRPERLSRQVELDLGLEDHIPRKLVVPEPPIRRTVSEKPKPKPSTPSPNEPRLVQQPLFRWLSNRR